MILRKFLTFFSQLSRKRQIAFVVWSFHLFFVFLLFLHHLTANFSHKKAHHPIAIRTINEPKQVVFSSNKALSQKEAPAPTTLKNTAPVKKEACLKKTTQSPPKKPSSCPQKHILTNTQETETCLKKNRSPPPQKNSPSPQKHLLTDMQKAIETLDALQIAAPAKPLPNLLAPKQLQFSFKETSSVSEDIYAPHLASYLENKLRLPERGEVKMELEIDRTGKLVHCTVLSSENAKNSEFLKNQLPKLAFPCFNDFDIEDNLLTFTILFRNGYSEND